MNKIKILATVGPACLSKEIIADMDKFGVDVFRINLSHTSVENYVSVLDNLRSWTNKPICTDTEGAQLRTGKLDKGELFLEANKIVGLTFDFPAAPGIIPLYPYLKRQILQLGDVLYVDFNACVLQVVDVDGLNIQAKVLSPGLIGSNKGIGVGRIVTLPFLTEKDHEILDIAKNLKLKHFSLSFASTGADVKSFREKFPYPITIYSKIENRLGIINLEEICRVSDEILVDRGDLSKEISITSIAVAQKFIVEKAREYGTSVVIATNLLDNMATNGMPSRAEVNDITSSLLDGAAGFVLAAETAIGKNPAKTARMLRRIIDDVVPMKSDFSNFREKYLSVGPVIGVRSRAESFSVGANDHKLVVDDTVLADCYNICSGVYAPLTGFMNATEFYEVLRNDRLLNGKTWTLPVVLQISENDATRLQSQEVVQLTNGNNHPYFSVRIKSISRLYDLNEAVDKLLPRNASISPQIKGDYFHHRNYLLEGVPTLINEPEFLKRPFHLSPRDTRKLFRDNNFERVLGATTRFENDRNLSQLKDAVNFVRADAVVLKFPTSIDEAYHDGGDSQMLSQYQSMLKSDTMSSFMFIIEDIRRFKAQSPREMVFKAMCARNYGCTHFFCGIGAHDSEPGLSLKKYVSTLDDLGIEIL